MSNLLPYPHRDVADEYANGGFGADARPGEQRSERREERAGKRRVVGILATFERIDDPAVDDGRRPQVPLGKPNQQREHEDANRDRPPPGSGKVVGPDGVGEEPIDAEKNRCEDDRDQCDADDLPDLWRRCGPLRIGSGYHWHCRRWWDISHIGHSSVPPGRRHFPRSLTIDDARSWRPACKVSSPG